MDKNLKVLEKLYQNAKKKNLPCFILVDTQEGENKKTIFMGNIKDKDSMYSFFQMFDENHEVYHFFQEMLALYGQVLERDLKQREIAKRFGIN